MSVMQAKRPKVGAFDTAEILKRGLHLHRQNRLEEAEKLYLKALEHEPRSIHGFQLLGVLRLQKGALESALELVSTSIEYSSTPEQTLIACLPTLTKLAVAFKSLSRYDEVLACCNLILAAPGDGAAINDRCEALLYLGRFEEALADAEQAVQRSPDNGFAHFSRGNALQELNRWEEAVDCYRQALRFNPTVSAIHKNMGGALQILGHSDDALFHFNQGLALSAADPDIKSNKGLLLLSIGRFEEGWECYDGRLDGKVDEREKSYLRPSWKGAHVDGTLFIRGEQGLGDQILYASMMSELTDRATDVVAEVAPRLVSLFARSFPDIKTVNAGTFHNEKIAAQAPIGSIGQYLRRSFDDFPKREQFLVADRDRTLALRQRLAADGRSVIGVSWKSKNPRFEKAKSAQLTDFAEVLRLPNCRFVDLQYGDTAADRGAAERELGVTVEHLDDIDNTNDIDGLASLICACDAVVSVSNTTVHLAGALGRPTWTFLPFGHARFWYWFTDRSDSPFYAQMRLHRQGLRQPWADLITAAVPEIRRLIAIA